MVFLCWHESFDAVFHPGRDHIDTFLNSMNQNIIPRGIVDKITQRVTISALIRESSCFNIGFFSNVREEREISIDTTAWSDLPREQSCRAGHESAEEEVRKRLDP